MQVWFGTGVKFLPCANALEHRLQHLACISNSSEPSGGLSGDLRHGLSVVTNQLRSLHDQQCPVGEPVGKIAAATASSPSPPKRGRQHLALVLAEPTHYTATSADWEGGLDVSAAACGPNTVRIPAWQLSGPSTYCKLHGPSAL